MGENFINLVDQTLNSVKKTIDNNGIIDNSSKEVFDKLFSKDSIENQMKIIELYKDALRWVRTGNEQARNFFNSMNELMSYLFDNNVTHSYFCDYARNMEDFSYYIQKSLYEFCNNNSVELWSKDDFSWIQVMISVFSGAASSPLAFEDFEKLEKKVKFKGKSFSTQTKNDFLNSMLLKRETIDPSEDSQTFYDYACYYVEGYYLDMATDALNEGDLDDIWGNDAINLMLQMHNTQRISHLNSEGYKIEHFKKSIEEFCEEKFPRERLDELNEKLKVLVEKYRDRKIDNPNVVEEFEDAYKQLYLYELVSGTQRDEQSYPIDYDLFLVRQFESINAARGETVPDYRKNNTLFLRAMQSIIVKQLRQDLLQKNGQFDTPTIVRYVQGFYFNKVLGSVVGDTNIIDISNSPSYTIPKITSPKGSQNLNIILVLYHEMEHYLKMISRQKSGFTTFDEYKSFKETYAEYSNTSFGTSNYDKLYDEYSANFAAYLAQIRILRQFPLREDVQAQVDARINRIENELKTTVYTTLDRLDEYSQKIENKPAVLAMDAGVLQTFKESKKKNLPESLTFEYKADATPKEISEIMREQYDEENGELNISCGPKSMTERAKIRMQIMMERAMATGKEEECFKIITEYVSSHKESFMAIPSNNKDTSFDLNTILYNSLKDGQKEGFNDALFLVRFDKFLERVKDERKIAFGEDVLNFFASRYVSKPQKKQDEVTILSGNDSYPEV